ncbi:MAG: tetratricopeptide repeat protein [Chloroflexi bacterium]|nr:tetratricopeptide repeat protein [Chloroflexota bacterium]
MSDIQKQIAALNAQVGILEDNDPQQAYELCLSAYQLAIKQPEEVDKVTLAHCLYNLGYLNYRFGHYNLAQQYLRESAPLFAETGILQKQAGALRFLGLIQWRLGNNPEMLNYHYQAIGLYQKSNDQHGEAISLSDIGLAYFHINDLPKTLEYLQKALDIYNQIDHPQGKCTVLNNLAMTHTASGSPEKALDFARHSLNIARRIDNKMLETNVLDTTGEVYLSLGEPKTALAHFQQSLTMAQEYGYEPARLTALQNAGKAYLQLGDFEQAVAALEEALTIAETLGAIGEEAKCHWELARIYKKTGRYAAALRYYERYHDLNETIFKEKAAAQFESLQVLHEMEQVQREQEMAQKHHIALEKEVAVRTQAEKSLQESEARYRQMFEGHTAVQWIVDPETSLIVDVNPAAAQFYGYTREEMRQMPIAHINVLPPEEIAARLAQAKREARTYHVVPHKLASGEIRQMEIHANPITLHDRTFLYAILHDVTDRLKAEAALRQAQKLESLGILAGGIAHDFNNLLVAMLGQTYLALAKLPPESSAQPHVEKAALAAEQAADLTRQMLAFSGKGQFHIQPINMNKLIETNLHLFQTAAPKNVRLRSQLADSLPLIEADAGQMQQVVMNLIINGAEAIGERPGTVWIRTSEQEITADNPPTPHFAGDPLKPGRYIRLEVEDDGAGMDVATLEKIFDPFFTTKDLGHGLGLAAVLGIVRGHQGCIQVSSQAGEGTTFTLFFPALAEPEPAADTSMEEGTAVTTLTPPKIILVIDDEETVCEAVCDILELDDIEAITASDGAKGLALFQARQADIGAVILDLTMPGMSGEETFQALREMDTAVPIILSSGFNEDEITHRFPQHKPNAFLHKPYRAEQLLEIVKSVL